ncbi:MAG: FeoB-associated Cys-rich membrane protein [Lachnospiraceae bacterium]|nr:FeoB-associated Cys-rich membrane protein [Lachnospiraceae bacterium]
MNSALANIIIILILVIALSAACFYIYKEKKNGRHCIGCPMAGSCPKNRTDCSKM